LNVPVRNLFSQLRVAVAGQELDGVGRHTWLCVLLLQLELVECLSPHVVEFPKNKAHQSGRWDELAITLVAATAALRSRERRESVYVTLMC